MTPFAPTSFYRATTAVHRPPCRFYSAVRTMLWIFCRSTKFSTMFHFVTSNAKRFSVGYIKSKFWKFRNRLYVVGVQISTAFTAILAGIIVAFVNGISPFRQFSAESSALSVCGFSSLPVSRLLSNPQKTPASSGAKSRRFVIAIEYLATRQAFSFLDIASYRPAFPRAVFCGILTVIFDAKFSAAFLAFFRNMCVFHVSHYNTLSPAYVAVALERWSQLTGKTPELLEA